MRGIFLATLTTLAAFGAATLLFRAIRIERRAYTLLWIFAVGAVCLIGTSTMVADDLSFLPEDLLAQPRWFDLLSSLFFYSAAFFGGVLQLYNLADRGLSLRILIDVLELGEGNATIPALFYGYSQGKGMRWMYQKRIDGMAINNLIVVEKDALILTKRGDATAKLYARLRRLLNVRAE